jgi:hypothetical protein
MSKHTPGPWQVGTTDSEGNLAVELYDSGPITALVLPMGEDFDSSHAPERDANARLIAAAPELLEALQAFVDSWGRGYAQRLQAVKHGRNILARIEAEP